MRKVTRLSFREIVEALAADERSKSHTILADRLLAQLRASDNGRYTPPTPPSANSLSGPLVAELIPQRRLDDLILPADVTEVIHDLIEEQHRGEICYERMALSLAIACCWQARLEVARRPWRKQLAYALNVPLLLPRHEGIIGSYLEETGHRIGQVFEHARSRRCVLFFDEFDTVAKERGDRHETGEIKRVVSSLLLQIDALPNYVVVVTASNHPELLDRAVWRRFQIRLELPMPQQGQIEEWFKRFEIRTGCGLALSPRSLRNEAEGAELRRSRGLWDGRSTKSAYPTNRTPMPSESLPSDCATGAIGSP